MLPTWRSNYRKLRKSEHTDERSPGNRGDADAAATAPERSSRLAVCRDRGGPWPVLRHWWHRLDDVHLQRDPGAGVVHHDPCHHRGWAGRGARAHWWPSSVLAAQPGTAATGGVRAVEPLASCSTEHRSVGDRTGRQPAGTQWVHAEPAGRGVQRARAVTKGVRNRRFECQHRRHQAPLQEAGQSSSLPTRPVHLTPEQRSHGECDNCRHRHRPPRWEPKALARWSNRDMKPPLTGSPTWPPAPPASGSAALSWRARSVCCRDRLGTDDQWRAVVHPGRREGREP